MKRLPLWCSVPAGVLAAHALGYLIVYGNSQSRVLASTGHGYLRHAAMVGVIGAAVGVSISVARGICDTNRSRWWDAALRLAALQAGAFFAVEVLERIAAGVPISTGMSRVLIVGSALQVLMGAFVSIVLGLFEHAGRTIAGVLRRALRPHAIGFSRALRRVALRTPTRVFAFAAPARAPPAVLVCS